VGLIMTGHAILTPMLMVIVMITGDFLGMGALRTLAFLALVFGNQATTYANRTRQNLWSIRPSALLLASSAIDLLIATVLAHQGIAMAPVPFALMGEALLGAAVFALAVDAIKVPVFKRLRLA
jgi:H+-transporting ATPase